MNDRSQKRHALTVSILAAFLSVGIGLVLGFLLLLCMNPQAAASGMGDMLVTGISDPDRFGKVLYQAAPLMLCGLSVGFAFKTGLFNIGAAGQYTVGAFFALTGAILFQLPWWGCLLLSAAGGALWGLFPGLCKALFNVNEVISSIMFNWIAMYLVNFLFANMPGVLASAWGAVNSDRTAPLSAANASALLPAGGLDRFFGSAGWVNIGILIAAAVAVLSWFVLNRTTFGYELKACGYSRDASRYAGISAKRSVILSMVIAGALSGLGGGIYYLAGTIQFVFVKQILDMGFNGIPVALLAGSNPLGTIFTALFVSDIQVGGIAMQPDFSPESVNIVIAVIIYLSAFALLMREKISGFLSGRKRTEERT